MAKLGMVGMVDMQMGILAAMVGMVDMLMGILAAMVDMLMGILAAMVGMLMGILPAMVGMVDMLIVILAMGILPWWTWKAPMSGLPSEFPTPTPAL